jgi:hypothetical protein
MLAPQSKPDLERLLSESEVVLQIPRTYQVLNLEFDDVETCRQFEAPHFTVLTKFDRFADVFVPVPDEGVSKTLQTTKDLRSCEGAD